MNKQEFREQMVQKFPWLTDLQFEQIEIYKAFLQEQNKVHNLTRLAGDDTIYEEYFFSSVLLYDQAIQGNSMAKLLDIGSGSGIPGVVLKIIYPTLSVTLLESNQKKVQFLTKLVNLLHLDIEIWCGRAEELAFKKTETFDYVTARAVTDIRKLVEISVRFAKIGGLLLIPKSQRCDLELAVAKGTIDALHVVLLSRFSTNDHDHLYNLLVYEKTGATPPNFPRSWTEILKKNI